MDRVIPFTPYEEVEKAARRIVLEAWTKHVGPVPTGHKPDKQRHRGCCERAMSKPVGGFHKPPTTTEALIRYGGTQAATRAADILRYAMECAMADCCKAHNLGNCQEPTMPNWMRRLFVRPDGGRTLAPDQKWLEDTYNLMTSILNSCHRKVKKGDEGAVCDIDQDCWTDILGYGTNVILGVHGEGD